MRSEFAIEVAALLGTGDVAGVVDAVADAAAELDARRAACGAGCAHCCHARVTLTAPEALVLGDFLRNARNEDIAERVAAAHEATAGLTDAQRADLRRPCPLLDGEGRCLAYAVRPLACRMYFSQDAAVCAALAEGCPPEGPLSTVQGAHRLHALLLAALLDGLDHAGLAPVTYEMNAALARALAVPDATPRWLAGGSLFAGVEPGAAPDVLAAIRRSPRYGI